MAIDRETIRISKEITVTITGYVEDTTRQIVLAWGRAWSEIEGEWRVVISDLIRQSQNGKWPSARDIRRARRVLEVLEITHGELLGLADLGGVFISEKARLISTQEDEWTRRLIASQYPAEAGGTAAVAGTLNRVDEHALGAIVERTTEQVTALSKPLADDATEAMKRELIRGVGLGSHPRQVADRMLSGVEARFAGGLTRALNIARTELLDAHRSGAAAVMFANADVLQGWTWVASLDARTCPSCWSNHGTVHDIAEPGPIDHQQGRCARVPTTRSWKDLGFPDIKEPASALLDAQSTFAALPKADQLKIMGPVRLKALNSGALDWSDLSVRRQTSGWRDSMVPIPVSLARRFMLRGLGE